MRESAPSFVPPSYTQRLRLQRCEQRATREFFAGTSVSRNVQAAGHQRIEELFSATIQRAIRQLIDEQDRQIATSIDERDRALKIRRRSSR